MVNHNDYYYKGYDITNKNRMEMLLMGIDNPYGYNIGSNKRRIVNNDDFVCKTNQDNVKSMGK
ncbi:MAG: hypothetical protein RSF02_01390 [Bacilli bacterium]